MCWLAHLLEGHASKRILVFGLAFHRLDNVEKMFYVSYVATKTDAEQRFYTSFVLRGSAFDR